MDSMWIMQRRNWWNIFTLRYKSFNMKGLFCLVKSVGYIFWPDGFHGVWWLLWVSWWRKRKISEGIQETSFGRIWIGKLNMLKWCCGRLTTTVILNIIGWRFLHIGNGCDSNNGAKDTKFRKPEENEWKTRYYPRHIEIKVINDFHFLRTILKHSIFKRIRNQDEKLNGAWGCQWETEYWIIKSSIQNCIAFVNL